MIMKITIWGKQYPLRLDTKDLPLEIVSGGARGADRLGEKYAKENNYKVKKFIPDWEKGRSAGIF